jgi:DNA polymerase elongation subunit (family B)
MSELEWTRTEIWPPGPEGVFSGRAPAGAFAARADLFDPKEALPPEGQPLCVFILEATVLNYVPRPAVDDDSPYSDFAYDDEDDEGDEEEGEGEKRDKNLQGRTPPSGWKDIVRASQSCTIIKGVLPCGASAAIVVRDFRPHLFVEIPEDVAADGRAGEWAQSVASQVRADLGLSPHVLRERNAIAVEVVRRSKVYKFHPSPKDPTRHAEFHFARITFPNGLMRRSAAYKLLERRFTVEEWNLDEDFGFHDAIDVPPNAWCVIPAGKFRRAEGRGCKRTLRQFEFEASSFRDLLPVPAYLAKMSGSPPLPIREEDLPPLLSAFFDIEVASQSASEFPNAAHPHAEITTISIAFAWVGTSLPPALLRKGGAKDETVERFIRAELDARFEASDLRQERADFASSRAGRVALRSRRREDLSARVFDEAVETDPGLDSEPESEGEEAGWSSAEKKLRDKHLKNVREECEAASTYPWPSTGRNMRARSRVELVDPDACERLGRAAESARPGVSLNRAFLHVTMVNTRCASRPELGRVPCGPVHGVVVENYDTEKGMLMAFRDYVRLVMDVDGIRGYNVLGFDWPYMFKRADMHGVGREFRRLSHIIDHEIRPRQKRSKLTTEITLVDGLNCVDLYQVVQETLNSKMDGYKLENVARYYGLMGKHDVSFKHVIAAHTGEGCGAATAEVRSAWKGVVAGYCAQDANLCISISRAMKSEVGWAQAAKIMRTKPSKMWSAGQQPRVVHMMLWWAHRRSFILNNLSKPPPSFTTGGGGGGGGGDRKRGRPSEGRAADEDGDGQDEDGDDDDDDEDQILQLVETEGISYEEAAKRVAKRKNRFEGGSVLEPTVGFYEDDGDDVVETPDWEVRTFTHADGETQITQAVNRSTGKIANIGRDGFIVCEDFASLYPSMMIGMNLCLCTLLRDGEDVERLRASGVRVDEYRIGSSVYRFARNVSSVLPELLLDLKAARKAKKNQMKEAEESGDVMMALICNLMQLFYKIAMNSVYGAVGAAKDRGMYSCPPIAAVITYLGREHVHEAKRIATELRVPGLIEQLPCEVIYGDTDSIFVKVPRPCMSWLRTFRARRGRSDELDRPTFTHEERVTHAHEVGERIAEVCNALYKERGEKSVQLEFEKTIRVMLLWMKKQYGTLYVESLQDAVAGKFKLDVKGLAGKKRDREPITANAQMQALETLLKGDIERAWLIIRRVMLRMARGHVTKEDILIAKRIDNKVVSLRAAPPAHVSVVWHLEKQMPGQEPSRGQYVKYWLSAKAEPDRAVPPESVFRAYVQSAIESVKLKKEKIRAKPQLFKMERSQEASRAAFSRFFTGKEPVKKTIEEEAKEDVEHRIREHMKGDDQTLHARSEWEEIDMPDLFKYMGRMIGCFRVVLKFTKYGIALEELYDKCLRIATKVLHSRGYRITESQKRAADIGNSQMRVAMHKMLSGMGEVATKSRDVDVSLARCGVGIAAGASRSSAQRKK